MTLFLIAIHLKMGASPVGTVGGGLSAGVFRSAVFGGLR